MLHEEIRRILSNEKSKSTSRGFGDTIEKIANNTGLNKITEAYTNVTKKDCGCNKRKNKLNELFPYK